MKGRIAIPLHDPEGKLIGYAGRLVDEDAISEKNPRYKLPAPREHDGKYFEFHKSAFLYGGHVFKEPLKNLIVVEGFTHVWWLWQNGWKAVVALMGADCSPAQAKLILKIVHPNGRVWVMPDGNDAGRRCAESVMRQVGAHRFVRWVKLTDDKQPTDVSAEELQEFFGAEKSGTSEKPRVADPSRDSNVKADSPTAAKDGSIPDSEANQSEIPY
jgi:DNA primase